MQAPSSSKAPLYVQQAQATHVSPDISCYNCNEFGDTSTFSPIQTGDGNVGPFLLSAHSVGKPVTMASVTLVSCLRGRAITPLNHPIDVELKRHLQINKFQE